MVVAMAIKRIAVYPTAPEARRDDVGARVQIEWFGEQEY